MDRLIGPIVHALALFLLFSQTGYIGTDLEHSQVSHAKM